MSQAKATAHLKQGAAVETPTAGAPLRTFSPAERERISAQMARILGVPNAPAQESYVDIVFDGPPSHESGRFVEVENEAGESIRFGKWIERPDGYWALRIEWQHGPGVRQTEAVATGGVSQYEYDEMLPFVAVNALGFAVARFQHKLHVAAYLPNCHVVDTTPKEVSDDE